MKYVDDIISWNDNSIESFHKIPSKDYYTKEDLIDIISDYKDCKYYTGLGGIKFLGDLAIRNNNFDPVILGNNSINCLIDGYRWTSWLVLIVDNGNIVLKCIKKY